MAEQLYDYFRQNQFVIELRGHEFDVRIEAGAHRSFVMLSEAKHLGFNCLTRVEKK